MIEKRNKKIRIIVLNQIRFVFLIASTIILNACADNIPLVAMAEKEVQILPDYSGITIPPNIAPLNYTINEKAERYLVRIYDKKGNAIILRSTSGKIIIPKRKWHKLLHHCKGGKVFTDIYIKKESGWIKCSPIINNVAAEPIDSYIAYRLIEPGFETWNKMGIYQRCLENFTETPIMINDMSDNNCMNCHSFCRNESHTMMFHMRGEHPGTIIYKKGKLIKVNTKTNHTISPGVYPAWHPSGRYIAFSLNHIVQTFHSLSQLKTEVTDTLSDLIVFDIGRSKVFTCPAISSKDRFETYPTWSPDGKSLFFCSAKALPLTQYNQIYYDLLRIAFDTTTCRFGIVDTIVSASPARGSISFPRVSPDGKYIMFCISNFGNFSIWHPESDLFIKNLETSEISKPNINSNQSESYHSWSSNGRWIVFSSRRIDGLFTRLYFSYFDTTGKAYKPFIMPQKDPEFYATFLKSYNIPELITSKTELNPRNLLDIVNSKADTVSFVDYH